LARTPPTPGEPRSIGRNHMRTSVVVPIGVIVAVAILFVVIAVLSSAQRANDVALDIEQQLFMRALVERSDRVLREIESVAASQAAHRHMSNDFDPEWARMNVAEPLRSFFRHDVVFLATSEDHLIPLLPDAQAADANWFSLVQLQLRELLDLVRARTAAAHPAGRAGVASPSEVGRAVRIQPFLAGVASVGAVELAPGRIDSDAKVPIVLSVKLIDTETLKEIAKQLELRDLRKVDGTVQPDGDHVFQLTDDKGRGLARFAWTTKTPGQEIIRVVPFVMVALSAFALLAALVFRHMRHAAETMAATETKLRHLAMHDPLCGLPNRISFGERLETTIEKVRQTGATAAVFYIDLDHFKDVNDTLGHPVGDELLRSVAQRLVRTLRGDDLVTRLGGDEFAVLTSGVLDHSTLQSMGKRIIDAICSPFSIGNQSILIGTSIGIVVINQYVGGAPDVMRYADMALYRAKNEGRNRACVYDSAMDADLLNRKILEQELRTAIENDGLHVAYQPILNHTGERVLGVEALCRWTHVERGEIQPSEFIPVAEHSGLIAELGEQVLRRACLDGKLWPELTVAVNVSPLQFRAANFVEVVERILRATGFDATRLELEVTESTLLGNVEAAELAMRRLKALGVRLALDDFGTGYSSLLYLRRFPFDKLKIDSSFVRSIDRAPDAAAIVHAVVSLGRGLGMSVTAEGVETADQQLFLRAAGVHSMQGYRFGRPCRAEEFAAQLAGAQFSTRGDWANTLALAG
jgi:diguanylate cyclase